MVCGPGEADSEVTSLAHAARAARTASAPAAADAASRDALAEAHDCTRAKIAAPSAAWLRASDASAAQTTLCIFLLIEKGGR